jgi:hypothetical protein
VHSFVVVTASIFSFFAVFVIVGALMVTLPYTVFRSISVYLRGLIIASLVAMLSTSFAVPSMLKQLPGTWVRFLPPVWFLGLCQLIRGDHIERWVGSGLLVAERQFRKVQGYREIPSLLTALANTVSKKAVAEEVKVA